MSAVTITVSGPVGSGKSALCKEIEILCRALGVSCHWEGSQQERNLSGGDSHDDLAMYRPDVRVIEVGTNSGFDVVEAIARSLRYDLDHDAPDDGLSLVQRMALHAYGIANAHKGKA